MLTRYDAQAKLVELDHQNNPAGMIYDLLIDATGDVALAERVHQEHLLKMVNN